MRVLIAGGGTGGHVIPALAIARELQEAYDAKVVFCGTERGLETRLAPQAGYELRLLRVGQLNRVSLWTRAKTLASLPLALREAARLLNEFDPHAVISVGGYASGPAAIAAGLQRRPLLVFEPNVTPGMANRRAARFASVAAVHFEETGRWFRRYEVTGVPVRREFFAIAERAGAHAPTLLVFGGSQGARAINRAMTSSLPLLRERLPELRIVHQTGPREFAEVEAAYREAGVAAHVTAYIDGMAEAFAAADFILCRAGASTVAEVAAAGKPAIFVPLPTAADDHQRLNAEALARRGAALCLPESEMSAERLTAALSQLANDADERRRLGAAARSLARVDAARRIAELTAEIAKDR